MSNKSNATSVITSAVKQHISTNNLQAQTFGHGYRANDVDKTRQAAAHCVANASAGLLKRAFALLNFPKPDSFTDIDETNFELVLAMMGFLQGDSHEEILAAFNQKAAQIKIPDTHEVGEAQVAAAEILIALANEAEVWSQERNEGKATPSADGFRQRLEALQERQTKLEEAIHLFASPAEDSADNIEDEISSALLEAARYLLEGSREDVEAASGSCPTLTNEAIAEQIPELADALAAGAEGAEFLNKMANSLVAGIMSESLASDACHVGFLEAGEKEAELGERLLATIQAR